MRADEKGHWKRTDLVLAEAGGGVDEYFWEKITVLNWLEEDQSSSCRKSLQSKKAAASVAVMRF